MRQVVLPVVGTVEAWRAAVRGLAAAGVAPEDVLWSVGEAAADLFAGKAEPGVPVELRLSRVATEGIATAMLHKDPARFWLGHAAVLGVSQGRLRWGDRSDPVIGRLMAMEKTVRRAIHKMHAFVRFRELPEVQAGRRSFGAWFEPEHPVAEATGGFFANRFGDMDWAIATPEVTLIFDGKLRVERTLGRPPQVEDGTEGLWRTYFASIFNPARLNPKAMQSEMPARYWKNMPEADLIPALIRGAPAAVQAMRERTLSEAPPAYRARAQAARDALTVPDAETLPGAAALAAGCTRCALHGPATQVVWGEGPQEARLMIVGEAPGDREDLVGRPFVGPAGQLLDELLAEVGGERSAIYLTNAVKHFGYRPQGKRRLHMRPTRDHIDHCRWWVDIERRLIRPKVILGLGATAAEALTGRGERVTERAGNLERLADGTAFLPSLHPAYVLRLPDMEARAAARARLREDLAAALALVG